jgi:hypothetical protein
MTAEFAIEWVGFTLGEKRQLRSRWAMLRFSPEFSARFSGRVENGDPGKPAIIFISANDVRTFREHWTMGMDFQNLNELIGKSTEVVTCATQQWKEMAAVARR